MDWDDFVKTAMGEMNATMVNNMNSWGLGTSDRWDMDQAKGDIMFTWLTGGDADEKQKRDENEVAK